ncbi:unnamed protein product [Porites evermanni]|uniref:Uncharacterized protein n=1 Tax=Porites evermanni TaxID=104178 RepID=A0ABN8N4Y1_9CNID|nr:unnamed protein product [Porites evermanni]
MENDLADRFISERIIRKLKDTLQAQSSLPQNDLSLQLSCMQASASTLLEVKNILDGLSKASVKSVADTLANSDVHFVLQRFLFSSYYFLPSDGGMVASLTKGEVNRPSGTLIFCPLYVAVAEVLTHLVASPTFASSLSSTKILQLVLQDLNVLVLPSSEPDHFKMLLANIQFLWQVSKSPATSALFCNVSDTLLILINVFVSYQGPFEQLTTLVKSLVMFIAASVADDETSVYLLAEESCIDFIVDILRKSVSTGETYLNYQGVYAVDIANCIEKMSRFAGLQEALLGQGVVELLVTMIQIGDPFDDRAAASATNALMQCYGETDVPVLLQGLASDIDSSSERLELFSHNLKEQDVVPKNGDRKEVGSAEEDALVSKVQQLSLETEGCNVTEQLQSEVNSEGLEQNMEGIKENTDKNTGVSLFDGETTSKATDNDADRKGNAATETEKPKGLSQESRECDIGDDQQKEKFAVEMLELNGKVAECEVKSAEDVFSLQKDRGQICDSDRESKTISTADSKEIEEKEMEILPAQPLLEVTSQSETFKAVPPEQDDISSYLKEQIKSMGEDEIKYLTIPTPFQQPDLIKQSEPESTQQSSQKPFHYQQAGTDPVSGQDLHDIHWSLIELGVHNMYDAKVVGLLNELLEESKLREAGVFEILNHVPRVYTYKFLRTGSMERQLRVVPAYNKGGINAPFIHAQPEIDYHLVLKKFIFQMVPDHGSKMHFPGFTVIGPWLEKIPADLEEWNFCFVPLKSQFVGGKMQFYLSAEILKANFFYPILLSFVHMNIRYRILEAKGENLTKEKLKQEGITIRKIEENGPAVTVHYLHNYLTADYVLSLRHIHWPLCAAEWGGRQRYWPNSDTVNDVISYGCHLVPKQPPTLSKEDPLYGLFFQYSFARAENILLNKLNEDNPVLTDCLRMLKFLCEMHFDRPQLLKSYHMQTIVLLAAERLPLSHWKADNFVKHLLDLLDDLLHFLVAQYLPNYFIPAQNLFQQFSSDFLIDVAKRVSKVRKNPIKYLTPSRDPERFGIFLI